MSESHLFGLNGERTETARLPLLPSGWCWTTVEQVIQNFDGRRIPIKSDDRDKRPGSYPYYGASGIIDDIDDFLFDGDYLLIGEDGANLLTRSTPIAFRASGRFWVNNHAHIIQMRGGIPLAYLEWYLNGTNLQFFITGTAQPKLNQVNLNRIPIPVAPSGEQCRIVIKIEELFSDLDAGAAALKRAKANLKRYRAAVLKAAVEGKLTAEWRTKHPKTEPASKLLERILVERRKKWEAGQLAKFAEADKEPPKNWKAKYVEPEPPDTTDLQELPEGWCWATLPQLGLVDRGRSRNRPRNAPHLYGGPYPFVQTGDIRHADTFIRTFHQTYSEAGLQQSKLWSEGTLCITIAANIAETAILGFNGCFPDSVVGFVPISDDVSVRFVELFFRTVQERLEAFAPATAQKNLNLETLTQVAICLPPRDEQRQIVGEVDERLSVTIAAEQLIEANLLRATRLRQSILKQAFEGKLVPQDSSDEPASVLLERLSASRSNHNENGKERKSPRTKGRKAMSK